MLNLMRIRLILYGFLKSPFAAYKLVLNLLVVYVLHAESTGIILHNLLDELKLVAVLDLYLLNLGADLLLPLVLLEPLVVAVGHLLPPVGLILAIDLLALVRGTWRYSSL